MADGPGPTAETPAAESSAAETSAVETAAAEQVSCSRCGTTVDGPAPVTWSRSNALSGTTLLCDDCTRQHLRALEAKLDEEHW